MMSNISSESHSVMSDSLRPHGLYSSWNSPGQNTTVGSLSLLQGFFPTQGSNAGLPHYRWFLYQLNHQEAQAGIKIARRNINNLRYADDTRLMAESEEELKSLLKKVKEWKVGLKLSIEKTKIMASGPITSWQIDGERVKDFYFGGLQNHCRWWLQPWN